MAILGIIGDSLHSESPFHDVRVRRAIAHALDNGAIAKACGFGFLPACNQLISYPNEGYNPNIKGYPYNPKKAKELLTEAGYPNGFNSKLLFPPYAFVGDFCTMIQGYLAKVSININLVPTQQGLFAKIRNEGWKDALIILQMPTGVEKNMTFILRDRLSRSPAQYRNSVFIPEDYDEKLLKVNSERDDSKRVKMLQEVGEIAIDGYCLANPVLIDMSISAQNLQVHNLNAFKYYAQNWHPAEAWLVNE
jgi:peptide/nickel transport system substrate-binding protein